MESVFSISAAHLVALETRRFGADEVPSVFAVPVQELEPLLEHTAGFDWPQIMAASGS
jgi:hypothetical protein